MVEAARCYENGVGGSKDKVSRGTGSLWIKIRLGDSYERRRGSKNKGVE